MKFSEWFGWDPRTWIVDKGRPAKCLTHHGMPTAEHDIHEGLCVMGLSLASITINHVMIFPAWYGTAAMLSDESTVALHHGVDADWNWRMNVYRLNAFLFSPDWERLGSQTEISWRNGLKEMQHWLHGGDDGPYTGPIPTCHMFEEVADATLCHNLTPFQQLEFKKKGSFRVIGGNTGDHYRIRVGDGFSLIDPESTETLVSFCLHTERWIPSADQALALKLALEDKEMEGECLAGARAYPRKHVREATKDEQLAYKLEVVHGLIA